MKKPGKLTDPRIKRVLDRLDFESLHKELSHRNLTAFETGKVPSAKKLKAEARTALERAMNVKSGVNGNIAWSGSYGDGYNFFQAQLSRKTLHLCFILAETTSEVEEPELVILAEATSEVEEPEPELAA
jgi:hypothetical protein